MVMTIFFNDKLIRDKKFYKNCLGTKIKISYSWRTKNIINHFLKQLESFIKNNRSRNVHLNKVHHHQKCVHILQNY